MSVSFFVPGVPQPKGSTRSFRHAKTGRIITRADNADRLEPWEGRIAVFARQAGVQLLEGAVHVEAGFVMPRPKSHYGKRGLRPSAPVHHTQKPDADKLARAVLDALTGVAYVDDSQVMAGIALKRWADEGEPAGVHITIAIEEEI